MSAVETLRAEEHRSDDELSEEFEFFGSSRAVATTLAHAVDAVTALELLDAALMDPEALRQLAQGVEGLRRRIDAVTVSVAEHVDVAQPFKADGWFTAKRWLQHTLHLSGPEAYGRVQAARFMTRVPQWAWAESAGRVGVAQCKVMASIAANPRIDDDVLMQGAVALLDDAIRLPFDGFERLARSWEMLADPRGALDTAERSRRRRDAFLRPRADGGWDLYALLDDVNGVEFQQVLAWYVQAEFHTDWAEALERLGAGNVTMGDLRRSEPQRRADALMAMARAAAASPPHSKRPVPTVNLVVDAATMAAWTEPATGADESVGVRVPLIDPMTYRDVICRSERGHPLHPAHVAETTLWGLIRRVVIDTRGVIIDLGRSSRLFTGHAREAVMLLEERCVWTGCDQPTAWCHADHLDGWVKARGPTKPSNGAPLCCRHNNIKEQGFTVTRDADGDWHVYAPDGHEVT